MEQNENAIDILDLALLFLVGITQSWAVFAIAAPVFFMRHCPPIRKLVVTRLLPAARDVARAALPAARAALPCARAPLTVAPVAPDASEQPLPERGDIIATLADSVHLLIIGHTGGGKTTLMHAVARNLASHARVAVCDPDAISGTYPGYRVVGGGDDYGAIARAIAVVAKEIAKRRGERAAGRRSFPPLWLFIDETPDVVGEIPEAWAVLEDVLRRGRKLNIHLAIGATDSQVGTLKLAGKSHLLTNLVRVDVRRGDGARVATIDGVDHPLPPLPAVDDTVHQPVATQPPVQPRSTLTSGRDPLLEELLRGAVLASPERKTPGLETGLETGLEPSETTSETTSETRDNTIWRMLQEGKSKNKVAQWLGEHHGIRNKHKAYALINQVLASRAEAGEQPAASDDEPPAAFRKFFEGLRF